MRKQITGTDAEGKPKRAFDAVINGEEVVLEVKQGPRVVRVSLSSAVSQIAGREELKLK